MPQVQVTQDPVAVFAIVGLIGGAAILALLVSSPWLVRMPRLPQATDQPPGRQPMTTLEQPVASETMSTQAGQRPQGEPWSTTSSPSSPPWSSTERDPGRRD